MVLELTLFGGRVIGSVTCNLDNSGLDNDASRNGAAGINLFEKIRNFIALLGLLQQSDKHRPGKLS
ncbi:hypothetical protein [Roseibium sp.]|uniref:hypothetical protein n=1 Tax=Roseibium sp. TaxID=1936156 RepID=UPI003A97E022